MATSHTFSDPSINLNISPFTIYLLLDPDIILINREVLKKIERRKSVTGNIFNIRQVRKDLVVGGDSRKVLKERLGNANIIAEVLYPGIHVPEYLFSRIDYDLDNIDKTANQIRIFIKDLCEKDMESLKKNNNTYLISAKNELKQQLASLTEYLTKEVIKSGHRSVDTPKKPSINKCIRPIRSTFWNGLPDDMMGLVSTGRQNFSSQTAEPDHYHEPYDLSEDKISFDKKPFLKVLSQLGLTYENFKDKIKEANEESIVNTKDFILKFPVEVPRSRVPGMELETNFNKKICIKIGTKVGCIFYGLILFSMYEGKKFKRSDLIEIVNQVKKKFKETGNIIFSEDDYESIPGLSWFEAVYKAVLGKGNGTFVNWCIEEYNIKSLNTAPILLKDNIEAVLKAEYLEDIKDLLLIKKEAQKKGDLKLPQQLYWIDFPIDQVEFPDDKWGDLKKKVKQSKSKYTGERKLPE